MLLFAVLHFFVHIFQLHNLVKFFIPFLTKMTILIVSQTTHARLNGVSGRFASSLIEINVCDSAKRVASPIIALAGHSKLKRFTLSRAAGR